MATWTLDDTHLEVGFAVKHLMVANVKGRFHGVTATIEIDEEEPANSSVVAQIETATVDTRAADRDAHLRSPDFFDSEQFPLMTFRSTEVTRTGDRAFALAGDLTIRDVTRPVTLAGEIVGPVTDPFGNRKAGFEVTGEIDRETWGLTWNMGLEAGGVLVGKTVKIAIEGEIAQQTAAAA